VQLPREPGNFRPLARLIPQGVIIYRRKAVSSSFNNSVLSVACWTNPSNPATVGNNYRVWQEQTSAKFFRQFASSPRNMGPYYSDGVELDYAKFTKQFWKTRPLPRRAIAPVTGTCR